MHITKWQNGTLLVLLGCEQCIFEVKIQNEHVKMSCQNLRDHLIRFWTLGVLTLVFGAAGLLGNAVSIICLSSKY